MPIYEYQCSKCHHQFDLMQKMSADPVKNCPSCSEDSVVRLVSAAGFQLKGTGWYETDFKNKGKPEPKSDKPASDVKNTDQKTVAPTTPSCKSKGESD